MIQTGVRSTRSPRNVLMKSESLSIRRSAKSRCSKLRDQLSSEDAICGTRSHKTDLESICSRPGCGRIPYRSDLNVGHSKFFFKCLHRRWAEEAYRPDLATRQSLPDGGCRFLRRLHLDRAVDGDLVYCRYSSEFFRDGSNAPFAPDEEQLLFF